MTEAMKSRGGKGDELLLLHRIEQCYLLLLTLLTAGGWYMIDQPFAQSVLIGGVLAGCSFFRLKRTAMRFAHHAAASGVEAGADGEISGKSFAAGFAVKFTVRLFILAFLLLLVSRVFSINAIGLVIGLSTVMVSVILVVLFQGRIIFQENM